MGTSPSVIPTRAGNEASKNDEKINARLGIGPKGGSLCRQKTIWFL